MFKFSFLQTLFYAGFLVFPIVFYAIYQAFRRKRWLFFLLLASFLFIEARFIEPRWIRIQKTTIPMSGVTAKIILISDLHLGVFKTQDFLMRIVEKVNGLEADFVLIAGDFIYAAEAEKYAELFAPLARLNKPIYAVLGNHDYEEDAKELSRVLEANKVQLITEKWIDFSHFRLTGLGDLWMDKTKSAPYFLPAVMPLPTLVLAHNPDSAMQFLPDQANLLLAGHTHCGQVRIPFLYRYAIPSRYGFDCGLESAALQNGTLPVFISSGLGEIGLPLRFLNPPTIDLLLLEK